MTNKSSVTMEDNKSSNDDVSEEVLLDAETPVLFSPSPCQWGDCEVPDVPHSSSPEKVPEKPCDVPKVLCDLYNNGARYVTAPKFTWNTKTADRRIRLRKELSVVFSVDTVITSQQIVYGFDAAGIDIDQILSIQRRASNNTWEVSFRTPEAKNMALGVPSVTIAGCTVFNWDCENRVQIVKIYEAPTEMPDTVLIGRLSHYGKVFSFRRDKVADDIYNGVRTAKMRLNLVIPPTIFVAGELVRIWYPAQPKMCRRCGDPTHVAARCSSMRCFNCEAPGHRIEQCKSMPLCSICLGADHEVATCPFFLYSANVVTQSEVSPVPDVPEAVSPPVASPSYAAAASRSLEQTEAVKAARAAGSGSTQSSENLPSAHQSSSPSSKQLPGDSTKQAPTQPLKKAASEPPPSVLEDRVPAPERHAERERGHSRERRSGP